MPTIIVNKRYNKDPDAVYIGRPSLWGNPFTVEKYGRDECIRLYEERLRSSPRLLSKLPELVGKTLVCYCKPLPCHGDILVKLIQELGLEKEDAS